MNSANKHTMKHQPMTKRKKRKQQSKTQQDSNSWTLDYRTQQRHSLARVKNSSEAMNNLPGKTHFTFSMLQEIAIKAHITECLDALIIK